MGSNVTFRRIMAVLLLVIAIIMVAIHLLPSFGFDGVFFYAVLVWPFAIIALISAWLLWRGIGDGVAEGGAMAGASDGELARQNAALEAKIADLQADLDVANTRLSDVDITAEQSADLASDGKQQTTAWASRREFAGKSTDDLNQMFGGGFVDGTMCRHFKIDYTDSKGQESEREILVYAMVQRRGYINLDSFPTNAATCLTFRADRIRKLTDMQNGDVVTENIQEYLLDGREMPTA